MHTHTDYSWKLTQCIRMGELEQWQDEVYIQQLWFNLNEKVMVKVIRDKVTG